jgi:transcriptional regulator with GAF, ATPase, and Fis domain
MDGIKTDRQVKQSFCNFTTVQKLPVGGLNLREHLEDKIGEGKPKCQFVLISRPNPEGTVRISRRGVLKGRVEKGMIDSVTAGDEKNQAHSPDKIKLANSYDYIIGQSDGLRRVLHKVEQIAGSKTTVLILGETGTGKELVSRAIHESSARKDRAMVKVNCAALPATLIESELFGHEKGAFTNAQSRRLGRFEIADKTTLFLDEIGELPLESQAKLLRVLEEGAFERLGGSKTIKVNVRIIAATNRNLEEDVGNGRFREDLWYRLNVFPITLPPLRDRLEDIPMLVHYHVKKIGRRLKKSIELVPHSVMDALKGYHWPGNIRELENVLERAVINSSGPVLRLADELRKSTDNQPAHFKTLEAVERDYIFNVLQHMRWKVSGKNSAAEILGLDRSTLRARMRKLNIKRAAGMADV